MRRPEAIQDVVYEIGRREPFLDEKKKAKDGKPGVSLDWFNMLYQVLLGQEKGPRFGSFVAAYGLQEHGRHDRRRAGAERVAVIPVTPRSAGLIRAHIPLRCSWMSGLARL